MGRSHARGLWECRLRLAFEAVDFLVQLRLHRGNGLNHQCGRWNGTGFLHAVVFALLVNTVSAGITAHFDTIRIVIGGWYGGVIYAAVSGTLVGRRMPPYRWGVNREFTLVGKIQGRAFMPGKSHLFEKSRAIPSFLL